MNNSSTKDDSFVWGILPLNTNDDILSDSFLTFERQIQRDLGFVSKLLNRKSAAATSPPTPTLFSIHPINYKDFPSNGVCDNVLKKIPSLLQCQLSAIACKPIRSRPPTANPSEPFVYFLPQEILRTICLAKVHEIFAAHSR